MLWFSEPWQVIAPSEGVVALHAAPRGTDDVDRAVVAPRRTVVRQGWVGQTARSDEFSWLAVEASDERRGSVDSLVQVPEHSCNKRLQK